MFYIYIVQCSDKSFYTGSTANVTKRIWEHNNSLLGAKSIRGKRPVKLVYQEVFNSRALALKREAEIKSWNRAKKITLVESSTKKR